MSVTSMYPICDECALPVEPDDAGPSCGAHDLHAGCVDTFTCRWCRDYLDDLEADRRRAPGPDDVALFDDYDSEPCS